jgi:hypothetical protein
LLHDEEIRDKRALELLDTSRIFLLRSLVEATPPFSGYAALNQCHTAPLIIHKAHISASITTAHAFQSMYKTAMLVQRGNLQKLMQALERHAPAKKVVLRSKFARGVLRTARRVNIAYEHGPTGWDGI